MRTRPLLGLLLGLLISSLILAPVVHAEELPPPPPYQPQEGPPPEQQPPPYQQPPTYQQDPQPPPYQPPPAPPAYSPYPPPPVYSPYGAQPGYSPYAQPGYSPYARPLYMQPRQPATPQPGTGTIVVGAIFLPLGITLIAGSALVWNYACSDGVFSCFGSPNRVTAAYGAVFMDIFGVAFTVMGAIFLPTGIMKQRRYNQWKKSKGLTLYESDKLHLGAVVSGGLQSGTMGLRLEF